MQSKTDFVISAALCGAGTATAGRCSSQAGYIGLRIEWVPYPLQSLGAILGCPWVIESPLRAAIRGQQTALNEQWSAKWTITKTTDVVFREARDESEARKRHRGVGREGLQPGDQVGSGADEQGFGREGAKSVSRRREP
jgi:hypothetical protein